MDSVRIPAGGGVLGLEQIWAGGRCIEMPIGHPVPLQQAAGAQKRGCLPEPVSLGLHWGKAPPGGGHGGEVPGGGLGDTGASSSSPSGLWVALGRGSPHILEKRQQCVGEGEGQAAQWSPGQQRGEREGPEMVAFQARRGQGR